MAKLIEFKWIMKNNYHPNKDSIVFCGIFLNDEAFEKRKKQWLNERSNILSVEKTGFEKEMTAEEVEIYQEKLKGKTK